MHKTTSSPASARRSKCVLASLETNQNVLTVTFNYGNRTVRVMLQGVATRRAKAFLRPRSRLDDQLIGTNALMKKLPLTTARRIVGIQRRLEAVEREAERELLAICEPLFGQK
jgi:hypothetical protein